MTKRITKVIAALGVVAGLGVATMPLSTYAADTDVEVQVRIQTTTGTIEPDCLNGESGAQVPAGSASESECNIGGSSNTGIAISIKDKDATLDLTGYSDSFEGATTNGSVIPAITSRLTDANFAISNLAAINSGAGGWGYMFDTGGTTGLNINTTNVGGTTTASDWNGITASAVLVASSTAATEMDSDAAFSFRSVTPPSQTPGYYSDVVTITVATNP